MELAKKDPVFEEAWGVIKYLSGDEESRALAAARERELKDAANCREGSFLEGKLEGELEALRKVATRALKSNKSHEEIAGLTGLPLDEIQSLADSLSDTAA
jgi:predicted transposase YdaD